MSYVVSVLNSLDGIHATVYGVCRMILSERDLKKQVYIRVEEEENDEVIMLHVGNQWLTVLNEEIFETCTGGEWTRMIAAVSCGWMRLP